jgi:hypothetical protein
MSEVRVNETKDDCTVWLHSIDSSRITDIEAWRPLVSSIGETVSSTVGTLGILVVDWVPRGTTKRTAKRYIAFVVYGTSIQTPL